MFVVVWVVAVTEDIFVQIRVGWQWMTIEELTVATWMKKERIEKTRKRNRPFILSLEPIPLRIDVAVVVDLQSTYLRIDNQGSSLSRLYPAGLERRKPLCLPRLRCTSVAKPNGIASQNDDDEEEGSLARDPRNSSAAYPVEIRDGIAPPRLTCWPLRADFISPCKAVSWSCSVECPGIVIMSNSLSQEHPVELISIAP